MTEGAEKRHQVPWVRMGAEVVAIIASILIAFSLDAWWDGRELAEREHRYLVSLEQDFRENRADLERVIQVQNSVLESIQQLVLFGATAAPIPDSDSVMGLVNLVFRDTNVGLRPSLSTYRDLLNTSSLQVLGSGSLRTLLADFDVRVGKAGGVEEGAGEGWSRDVTEHLLTRLDLAAQLPQYLLGTDSIVEILPSTVDYRSLPADRVFRNVMVGRLAVTAVRLSMYRALEGNVAEILRVLRQELGG
jgi:hypothetical protein